MQVLILFLVLFTMPLACVEVTVNDNGDESVSSKRMTLRSAIEYINAKGESANTIRFALTSSPFVIKPKRMLPTISVPVFINGYSSSRFTAKNSSPFAHNAKLAVVITGPGPDIPTVTSGLTFGPGSDGSRVEGLVINNFIGDGLTLFGSAIHIMSNGCKIRGNFLGVDQTGTKVVPNLSGVVVEGDGNMIGGKDVQSRNLIAGSLQGLSAFYSGLNFEGNQMLPYPIGALFISGSSNFVENNFIGTDASGTKALLNDIGIRISGTANTIGKANVINAGITAVQIIGIPNTFFGLPIPPDLKAGQNNIVTGNFMGTDSKGQIPFESAGIGIHFAYGPLDGITPQNNLIIQNRISGFSKGIQLGAVNTPVLNNTIQDNQITSNSFYGILATNALFTTIEGNLISGNGHYGIYFTDQVAANAIENNMIGTDSTGKLALPNGKDGIRIATPFFANWWQLPVQQNNSTRITHNIISGNRGSGIHIASNTTNNIVQGNKIGLSIDDAPLGNGEDGIKIVASSHNLIGGSPLWGTSLDGNQIAYNRGVGVRSDDSTNAVIYNKIWENDEIPSASATTPPDSARR